MLGSIYVNVKDVCKYNLGRSIAFILNFNSRYKKIYLIGERKDEAKDNGYHFFKYVREKHKEDKFYYVIDKNSNDLYKVLKYNNVIYYNSIKHFIFLCLADKIICAHGSSCIPESSRCWRRVKGKKIKRIFIQHGITQTYQPNLIYDNANFYKFICGGMPEYTFIKGKFGYKEDDVKYLGFCRFDNLFNINTKKQILLMPTWRAWLKNNDKADFLNSQYFNVFNSLINSIDLDSLLKKYNMELIFYPHYEMQCYLEHFRTESKRIKIASKDEYDVQTLLRDSNILITDYSSVFFDFAYMRKSILYYQFDESKYYRDHYVKGYFDFNNDGFGPVVREEKNLIIELKNIIVSGSNNEYLKRMKEFFPLYDNDNCKRHYEEVIKD